MKFKYSYLEYVALPTWKQLLYKLMRAIFFVFWAFYDLIKGIGISIWHGCLKIGESCKRMYISMRYGDWATKLSFLFLGAGYIKRKQIVKGIIYIVIEIAFVLFFALAGWKSIGNLFTLGLNDKAGYLCNGSVYTSQDEAEKAGCLFPTLVEVDNSAQMLLFGCITLFITLAFIIFYCKTTANAFKVECNKEEGKHINTFKDDVGELLNGKFHITLLFLPILGILVFTVFPLLDMILMAFTNYDKDHQFPLKTFDWVGFENFAQLFNMSKGGVGFGYTFGVLLRWTIVWAIFATLTNFVFGVLIATLINKKGIKLKKMWRTFMVLSVAVPQFVSLLAMSQFLADTGVLATLIGRLTSLTPEKDFKILGNGSLAKVIIILVNIWIGVPYTILSTTGILMNIPADLYESAKIDGANAVKMYTKITVPYILFVLGPSLITTFIGNVNNFGVIYLLTGGGPMSNDLYAGAGETSILITWLWALTKDKQLYNMASVIGILIFIISAVLSLIVYRNSGSYKNEEDFA